MNSHPGHTNTMGSQDLKWAVEETTACKSAKSCIKHGTCLDRPICDAVIAVGKTAGFVLPTESANECGYCHPSFGGFICFCPTRWALLRTRAKTDTLETR